MAGPTLHAPQTLTIQPFAPDPFSRPAPPDERIELEDEPDVIDIIEQYYPKLGPVEVLHGCGGFGLNSTNIAVRTATAHVVVKRKPSGASETLSSQAALAQWLHKTSEVPVPALLPNTHGALLTAANGALWIVQRFAVGAYFTGDATQLQAFSSVLSKLDEALSDPASHAFSIPKLDTDYGSIARSIEAMNFNEPAFAEAIGEPYRSLLRSTRNSILAPAIREAVENGLAYATRPCQPTHIDLHPHNVLMNDRAVSAILDWDSFMAAPPVVITGFSLIKMGRQAAASGLPIQTITQAFKSVGDRLHVQPQALFAAGLFEIIRRLHTVLTFNLENRDRTWNWVLPVLLQNMAEALELIDAVNAK